MLTCSVGGCEKPVKSRGMCSMHNARMERHGNTDGLMPQGDPFVRLMAKVEKRNDGCWVWTGASPKNGYAVVGYGRYGWYYGHRLAYERLVGPIPTDKPRLHHTCETPRCVNPDHLIPMSAADHAREHGLGEGPCRACGHDDFYVRRDNGVRMCRECRRRRRATRRAAQGLRAA